MKALVYKGPSIIELEDVKKPSIKGEEILVKVRAVGICGSDVEGYLGKTGRRTPPMIMGHEFSGEIEETGPGSRFKKGDRVVIQPKLYCGKCEYCQKGLTNICPRGLCLGVLDQNGAMTEYIAIEEKYAFKLSDGTSFVEASMIEPLAVAFRAVSKVDTSGFQKTGSVLVIGAGTIGLLVLQLLKYKGIKDIIISDLSDYRLEKAKLLGAKAIINPGKDDFFTKISKLTGGKMVDYSIEAVGLSVTAAKSLEALKIGGTAIWIGNAQKIIEINMQKIVTNELNIKGTYTYSEQDFMACLRLVTEEKINFSPIISCIEKLENGVEMFQNLANNKDGQLIKVILTN